MAQKGRGIHPKSFMCVEASTFYCALQAALLVKVIVPTKFLSSLSSGYSSNFAGWMYLISHSLKRQTFQCWNSFHAVQKLENTRSLRAPPGPQNIEQGCGYLKSKLSDDPRSKASCDLFGILSKGKQHGIRFRGLFVVSPDTLQTLRIVFWGVNRVQVFLSRCQETRERSLICFGF